MLWTAEETEAGWSDPVPRGEAYGLTLSLAGGPRGLILVFHTLDLRLSVLWRDAGGVWARLPEPPESRWATEPTAMFDATGEAVVAWDGHQASVVSRRVSDEWVTTSRPAPEVLAIHAVVPTGPTEVARLWHRETWVAAARGDGPTAIVDEHDAIGRHSVLVSDRRGNVLAAWDRWGAVVPTDALARGTRCR